MGNGEKTEIINPRERVISNDINRLQAFAAADHNEAMRYVLQAICLFEVGSTIVSNPSTVLTPLAATVLGGLMAQPGNGTVNMLVTPGVAYCVAPEASPNADDSVYKFVNDPGVQTNGVLTLTANGGGGIRIDVIECQPAEVILETDNRDQFEPGSGLFFPTLLNKVKAYRMTYRIRVGTSGSGFPGNASGWLPLAVASVPVGAASWDDVTLWDVRPLAAARSRQPFNNSVSIPLLRKHLIDTDYTSGVRLRGIVEAEVGQYVLGGPITKGTPGTYVAYVDVSDAANQAPGFAFSALGFYYVYLVTPFGLPRWAVYLPSTSGARVPACMGGIPTVASTTPNQLGVADVAMPASCGLGASTWASFAVAAGAADGASAPAGVQDDGVIGTFNVANAVIPSIPLAVVGGPTRISSTFNLIDGVTHPPHAKAVYVNFSAHFTAAGANSKSDVSAGVSVFPFAGASPITGAFGGQGFTLYGLASPDPANIFFTARVPLQPAYPANLGGPATRKLTWTTNVSAQFAFVSSGATVAGWEL